MALSPLPMPMREFLVEVLPYTYNVNACPTCGDDMVACEKCPTLICLDELGSEGLCASCQADADEAWEASYCALCDSEDGKHWAWCPTFAPDPWALRA